MTDETKEEKPGRGEVDCKFCGCIHGKVEPPCEEQQDEDVAVLVAEAGKAAALACSAQMNQLSEQLNQLQREKDQLAAVLEETKLSADTLYLKYERLRVALECVVDDLKEMGATQLYRDFKACHQHATAQAEEALKATR